MTIALFGNTMKSETMLEVSHILEFMKRHNVRVMLSQELRQELNIRDIPAFPDSSDKNETATDENEMIDFAVSVGGDGTFLTTASIIGDRNIPILGINCGHLGFLADVQTRDVDQILRQLIEGQYTIEQRSLLQVSCNKENLIMAPNALNEISILKQGFSSMIAIEVHVNGELLHNYHADGLVISTPTGSTAYNLSIGGPLIVPQSRVLVLSPIATHSLTVRPLVIPEDWKIDLKVSSRYNNYMISVDGRSQILSDEVQLHIERAPYTVKLVQIGENSFLQSLRTKLNWGK
ncbi:MAG: NAD kinase [Paludibacteraceae bacterium]|nr:NAD kinase [Paludibacteraceae bacterium]